MDHDHTGEARNDENKSESNIDDDDIEEYSDDESMTATTSCSNSRIETAHLKIGTPKPVKYRNDNKQKKKRPATGRVAKRAKKTRVKKLRRRDLSPCSYLSSEEGCSYCGHRCCRRRSVEMKKTRVRRVKRFNKKQLANKCMATQTTGSECIQTGSECLMLSPLCISTTASPQEAAEELESFCEITPEMIYESVRCLTKWRQEVATLSILNHIKRNYPVCSDQERLITELTEKLRIAVIVGIVSQSGADSWHQSCTLNKRKLTKNHVSLFWKAYGDTLKPVTRKEPKLPQKQEMDERHTNTII